jgi:hypothetical protein
MRRPAALFAIAISCSSKSAPPPPQAPLPAVHLGEAQLTCNIDSRANGEQKLVLSKGGGLEFDAIVAPMVDGTVDLKGPGQGGMYQFTSHLAKPAKGTLSGVGDVELETMDTKVQVTMDAYDQPGGPGSAFSFSSKDMARKGIYVEFSGVARAATGEKYAFRVNLGAAEGGSGRVQPSGPNAKEHMVAKAVIIEAPVTTVIQATTQVQKLP